MPVHIESMTAVRSVSRDAARLATFYRDVLGLPLKQEQHDHMKPHWGCFLGDLYFAVHPCRDSVELSGEQGAVTLAFSVFDIDAVAAMLERQGVELLYPPRDLGWCKRTAVSDPDGNNIELTELGADWYRHLEKHQEPSDPPPREPKLKALDSD